MFKLELAVALSTLLSKCSKPFVKLGSFELKNCEISVKCESSELFAFVFSWPIWGLITAVSIVFEGDVVLAGAMCEFSLVSLEFEC